MSRDRAAGRFIQYWPCPQNVRVDRMVSVAQSQIDAIADAEPHRRVSVKCRATRKRDGERCHQWAIPGLGVCRFHGGATKAARRAAERRLTLAQVGTALGIAKDVDPNHLAHHEQSLWSDSAL